MSDRSHSIASGIMASIGVLMLIAGAAVDAAGAITGKGWEIPHVVYYVATLIGFVGFYGRDNKRAKDGGEFVVTSVVRLIGAVRGRRASDTFPAVTDVTTEVKKKVDVNTPPPDKG